MTGPHYSRSTGVKLDHYCVGVCVFQVGESQRVLIIDLAPKPQHVEIVNLQPFEDDESREQDLTSSPTNTTTENRCVCA